jgi:hypothetical protein
VNWERLRFECTSCWGQLCLLFKFQPVVPDSGTIRVRDTQEYRSTPTPIVCPNAPEGREKKLGARVSLVSDTDVPVLFGAVRGPNTGALQGHPEEYWPGHGSHRVLKKSWLYPGDGDSPLNSV